MSKIKNMLLLQKELNDSTNGVGWESGINKYGKEIDWKRCIYIECVELIDNYPWKHWKEINKQPDLESIQLEVVDIWHFILSYALSLKSIEEIVKEISSIEVKYTQKNFYEKVKEIEELIKKLFLDKPLIEIVESFFIILYDSKLTLDELYELYIGKNILNKFRQNNGYKEGNYIKIWNGKEDNTILQELLRDKNLSLDELYNRLEIIYKEIK